MAEAINIIDLISTIVILIPSTVLLRNYLKTRIIDYLYFAIFFILGGFGLLGITYNADQSDLYLTVISEMMITSSTFVLFLHAIKIKWENRPRPLFALGTMWYLFLMVSRLLYENFEQPERARVIFVDLPRTLSGIHPNGAGWKLGNDTIIISSSFSHLWYFYLIFTLVITIISYLSTEIVNPTNRIIRARKLWLGAWISYLLYALIGLGFNSLFGLANIFILISVLMIGYISFTLPEGIFITKAQIIHATQLYQKIINVDLERNKSRFGYTELILYIQNIPKEYLESE